jgi:hypothetical protein
VWSGGCGEVIDNVSGTRGAEHTKCCRARSKLGFKRIGGTSRVAAGFYGIWLEKILGGAFSLDKASFSKPIVRRQGQSKAALCCYFRIMGNKFGVSNIVLFSDHFIIIPDSTRRLQLQGSRIGYHVRQTSRVYR